MSGAVPGPVLVLVGGFLGAGKTTLLLKSASLLRARGLRAAIIMNDQGGELVDTRLSTAAGFETEEITGGCFCCRLSDFVRTAGRLLSLAPQVIFAEPVGSCMDLGATVLEPLRRHGEAFRVAPFTVLVDPARANEALRPDADPYVAYLFRNQIAEADLVCFTRADLYADVPVLPGGPAQRLSAVTGEGVWEWLERVLAENAAALGRRLEVDYGRYAEAEAALGWLNFHARLRLRRALSPAAVAGPLLEDVDRALASAGAGIIHLKVFDQAATGYIRASVCRNGEEPWVDGALDASPAARHELVLNLRARAAPDVLRDVVERAVDKLRGRVRVLHFESFRPAPPKPEYRAGGRT